MQQPTSYKALSYHKKSPSIASLLKLALPLKLKLRLRYSPICNLICTRLVFPYTRHPRARPYLLQRTSNTQFKLITKLKGLSKLDQLQLGIADRSQTSLRLYQKSRSTTAPTAASITNSRSFLTSVIELNS